MSLPFDLRAFAVSQDPSDSLSDGLSYPANGVPNRPSRAILLPANLVAEIQARDVEAFRELVRVTYMPLLRFAHTIVGSRDECEDVVQEVFTALWDRAERWNPSTDPVSYLFSSVRNSALNHIRGRTRAALRVQHIRDGLSFSEATQDPAENALDCLVEAETKSTHAQLVSMVLETFTEHQRTAYDLRYRRGLTGSAIARILGITGRSAEQLISRVTHLMVARLQERLNSSE